MISLRVVIFNKGGYLSLQFPWIVVVIQKQDILQGPMITLDLTLSHGVKGLVADMGKTPVHKVLFQLA